MGRVQTPPFSSSWRWTWVFHRKAHAVSLREAAGWSAVWDSLAMAFNAGIWYFAGSSRRWSS